MDTPYPYQCPDIDNVFCVIGYDDSGDPNPYRNCIVINGTIDRLPNGRLSSHQGQDDQSDYCQSTPPPSEGEGFGVISCISGDGTESYVVWDEFTPDPTWTSLYWDANAVPHWSTQALCEDDRCSAYDNACGAGAPSEVCSDLGQWCTPNCDGKECGDDGCGGACGSCATGAQFACSVAGVCVCTPSCPAGYCGMDGCGTPCQCSAGQYCTAGETQSICTACSAQTCGEFGCASHCLSVTGPDGQPVEGSTAIDFGCGLVDDTVSLARTFRVANVSGGPITVDFAIAGTGFGIRAPSQLPATVAPGASADVVVDFNPATTGAHEGRLALTVEGGTPDPAFSVPLTGAGTSSPPIIGIAGPDGQALTPGSTVDFGSAIVGEALTWIGQIQNAGAGGPSGCASALLVSAPEYSSGPPPFAVTGSAAPPYEIAAGNSEPVTVQFFSDSPGSYASTLTIVSNDPAQDAFPLNLIGNAVAEFGFQLSFGDQQIPLDGAAPSIGNGTDWGPIAVGSSLPHQLSLTVIAGEYVTIEGVSIVGANADSFQLDPPLTESFEMGPGDQASLDIQFAPTASGPMTATLRIAQAGMTNIALVSLAGSGAIAPSGAGQILLGSPGIAEVFLYTDPAQGRGQIRGFVPGEDVLILGALLEHLGYDGTDPFTDGTVVAMGRRGSTYIMVDPDGSAGPQLAFTLTQLVGVATSALDPARDIQTVGH